MKFNYFQPTELLFGRGRVEELGGIARRFGVRTLLVTMQESAELREQYQRVKTILAGAGLETAHFDGVVPNPTVKSIAAGARLARESGAQSVIGLGGGSSMDSAKAIAVEATHKGSSWDYLFYKEPPTAKTLPVIAVATTSGTGSHVTQVAVITNTDARDKSAIYNENVYPKAAIVDPELMVTVPVHVTACTGFDVFCHAFESTLHPNCGPLGKLMAWEAIRLAVAWLPKALENGKDLDAREKMAWADTLAGYSIASAGVTLPHGMGMAMGGMYPHIAHGMALALVYPAFTRFTWQSAIPGFAKLGRIFDSMLAGEPDATAAECSCALLDDFLQNIGLRRGLADLTIPEAELPALARQCMVLPDYQANPRIATLAEIEGLLRQIYPARQ
jgi:alcohol dehydrogenase class IV